MRKQVQIGLNKTGIDMSPILSKELQVAVDQLILEEQEDATYMGDFRSICVTESPAIGSVPIPATFKGALNTIGKQIAGNNIEFLIDKLSERAAFERTGTRLYDALLDKTLAWLEFNDEVIPTLKRFRNEEKQHFQLVVSAMEQIGADPTAMTPCANVVGVASSGLIQAITDPRTNFSQCLNTILTAELTDNAGWELLIKLVKQCGYDDIAEKFAIALAEENEHLATIKQWLEALILKQA